MLSFFTVSNCHHFYVIIFPWTYFVLSFMLSFLGRYHFVIIYCYHDIYIMKNDNILYTQKRQHIKNDNILYNQKDNFKEFKNDNIYTIKIITSPTLKNDNIQPFKNDNTYSMKNDNTYSMKNDNILYT